MPRRLGRHFIMALALPCFAASVLLCATDARAAASDLRIRIIHASKKPSAPGIKPDSKLDDLTKQLAALKFTSIVLRDEATLSLELGASGKMQLPNKAWMTVRAVDGGGSDNLRLELAIKKLEFKATVLVAKGATVATRGPNFEDGVLVLAVTRLGAATAP